MRIKSTLKEEATLELLVPKNLKTSKNG